jgi:hypothetical protein
MVYRIVSWVAIAAGSAAVVAIYTARWVVAVGLGLLTVICVGIVWWKPPE